MSKHKPRLLDLFCGAGGAAMGYHRAGFEVVGVDIAPQKHYPFEFHQADALTYPLDGFDAIHFSALCEDYSPSKYKVQTQYRREYPRLILPMMERMKSLSKPVLWVCENVEQAAVDMPASIVLCGSMFGLGVKRHRLFQSNTLLFAPQPCGSHTGVISVFGHDAKRVVAGKRIGYGVAVAREAMGIKWMTQAELSQSIPPIYTEWIGRQLLAAIGADCEVA